MYLRTRTTLIRTILQVQKHHLTLIKIIGRLWFILIHLNQPSNWPVWWIMSSSPLYICIPWSKLKNYPYGCHKFRAKSTKISVLCLFAADCYSSEKWCLHVNIKNSKEWLSANRKELPTINQFRGMYSSLLKFIANNYVNKIEEWRSGRRYWVILQHGNARPHTINIITAIQELS